MSSYSLVLCLIQYKTWKSMKEKLKRHAILSLKNMRLLLGTHQSVTFYMNLPNLKGQKVKLRTIKQMTLKVTYAAFNQSHCGFDF